MAKGLLKIRLKTEMYWYITLCYSFIILKCTNLHQIIVYCMLNINIKALSKYNYFEWINAIVWASYHSLNTVVLYALLYFSLCVIVLSTKALFNSYSWTGITFSFFWKNNEVDSRFAIASGGKIISSGFSVYSNPYGGYVEFYTRGDSKTWKAHIKLPGSYYLRVWGQF